MSDTVDDVDMPYEDESASQQEKIETLQERLEVLESQNEEMRDKLLDANAENNKYQQKLERLTHENKKLKQSPLFVATVQELNDDGVVIKQHGNNQEALTEVTEEMRADLDPDDRVAVNNSLSVVKKLEKETDVRARVMQVEHSPDVTYADIGGIDEQMKPIDSGATWSRHSITESFSAIVHDSPVCTARSTPIARVSASEIAVADRPNSRRTSDIVPVSRSSSAHFSCRLSRTAASVSA